MNFSNRHFILPILSVLVVTYWIVGCSIKDSGPSTDESNDDSADESTPSDEENTSDATDSDSGQLIPLKDQPGFQKWPYASCPDPKHNEETCGGPIAACLVDDRERPTSSICLVECTPDGGCPPSDDREIICTASFHGCLILCKTEDGCPKGMFCENLGVTDTPYCAWPAIRE